MYAGCDYLCWGALFCFSTNPKQQYRGQGRFQYHQKAHSGPRFHQKQNSYHREPHRKEPYYARDIFQWQQIYCFRFVSGRHFLGDHLFY